MPVSISHLHVAQRGLGGGGPSSTSSSKLLLLGCMSGKRTGSKDITACRVGFWPETQNINTINSQPAWSDNNKEDLFINSTTFLLGSHLIRAIGAHLVVVERVKVLFALFTVLP